MTILGLEPKTEAHEASVLNQLHQLVYFYYLYNYPFIINFKLKV